MNFNFFFLRDYFCFMNYFVLYKIQGRSLATANTLRTARPRVGLNYLPDTEIFPYLKTSRPALGSWTGTRESFIGVKWQRYEYNHWPQPRPEKKNEWNYTSTSPCVHEVTGDNCPIVGCGTTLQVRWSRVRFLMVSLQKWTPGIFLGS